MNASLCWSLGSGRFKYLTGSSFGISEWVELDCVTDGDVNKWLVEYVVFDLPMVLELVSG